MRELWRQTRQRVIARAGGVCERCLTNSGRHVHHLRYWPKPRKRGGEPLEWLQLLCLTCHGIEHPRHTFRPIEEQRRIAKRRQKPKRPTCQHCGNTWGKKRHQSICVNYGLDTPYIRVRDR